MQLQEVSSSVVFRCILLCTDVYVSGKEHRKYCVICKYLFLVVIYNKGKFGKAMHKVEKSPFCLRVIYITNKSYHI